MVEIRKKVEDDPVHPKAPYNEAAKCYHGGVKDSYGKNHNNPKPMKKGIPR